MYAEIYIIVQLGFLAPLTACGNFLMTKWHYFWPQSLANTVLVTGYCEDLLFYTLLTVNDVLLVQNMFFLSLPVVKEILTSTYIFKKFEDSELEILVKLSDEYVIHTCKWILGWSYL